MPDADQLRNAMEAAQLRLQADLDEAVRAVEAATARLVHANAALARHRLEVEFAWAAMGADPRG